MLEQVLDPVTQGCRRAWAAGAGAAHMQVNDPVPEPVEGDIAAVIRDRRTHARIQELLDGADRILVLGIVLLLHARIHRAVAGHRVARHVVLHDGAEDRRPDVRPLGIALGHRDEVRPQEHACDALDLKQPCGERRGGGLNLGAIVDRVIAQHGFAGDELEGRRVRRRLGLDEHGIATPRGRRLILESFY